MFDIQNMKKLLVLFCLYALIGSLIISCSKEDADDPIDPIDTLPNLPAGATYLQPNPQPGGDAVAGYDYLVNGNYLGSGIPYDVFTSVFLPNEENVLNRTGDNATLPPDYTAITHANGVRVVTANCLQCHGSELNGEYFVGLGNINVDFTVDQTALINAVRLVMQARYPENAPEWKAFEAIERGNDAIGPYIQTEVVGVNPADQLFAVLGAHRDPQTLVWQDELTFEFPKIVIPTDVPPWWVLKKKNAPLYMGIGRGNYGKLFMAASTLTLETTEEAQEIHQHFNDVIAYLYSIEAPTYPHKIDEPLAAQGKTIFSNNCSKCHGTYGENETYPNLMIDVEEVGTDPLAISGGFAHSAFVDWFNESWFNTGDEPGSLELGNGYVAQPLDGIWASAPYLHNGSVPTLYHLLKSDSRPTYWRRAASSPYDESKVGWMYSEEMEKTDKFTYDTTHEGYGNEGHTYGDFLTEPDRMALIEYLKTL